MTLDAQEYRGPEQPYDQRTPPAVRRAWEDFQRAGFCTAISYAPFDNEAIAHTAMIFNSTGSVLGQASTQQGAITAAVKRGNDVWPVSE